MARFQEAMLQELRSGIHVLQSQDQIIQEATDLFGGMQKELEAQSKRISDNTLQLLAVETSTQTVQKGLSLLTKRVDEVVRTTAAITTSLKQIPTKIEFQRHASAMEEHKNQMNEVTTGLTTALEECKFSQWSPFTFRRTDVAAGPSGTQYVHPQRRTAFHRSPTESSPRDTGSEYSWHAQLRGGAGSDGGTDGGAAGGAEGGAAGGAAGGAGGEAAGGAGGGAAGEQAVEIRHHHRIHHPEMKTEDDDRQDDNGTSRNWNSPNLLKSRNPKILWKAGRRFRYLVGISSGLYRGPTRKIPKGSTNHRLDWVPDGKLCSVLAYSMA